MPPTLLCVDSDRNYCELLARTLRGEGYAVRLAHDGEEGLRVAEETRPDLVVIDVMLPRRDGFALLQEIRAASDHGRQVPAVLLSGCSVTDSYRSRAARLEAAALLTKPVPLERLLGLIGQQLRRGAGSPVSAGRPADAAEPAPPARRPPGTARLEGTLAEVPFAALLHHLHGMRASGVLHLQRGKKKKKIQLAEGHPVAVKSNLIQETLGELLVATGKITRDVLHASLLRVRRGEGLQGQILVAMHMLDEDDLARALRQQAEEKLLEVFGWTEGTFRFQRGVRLRGANTLSIKGSTANLVTSGVLMRVPRETIDLFFKDWGDARVSPSTRPFYAFQEIDLDEASERLLGRIDGGGTLSDLLPLDERARRLLYAWHAVELIELHRTDSRATTRPAPILREAPAAVHEPEAPPRSQRGPVGKVRPLPPPAEENRAPAGSEAEEGIRSELTAMAERLRQRDAYGVLGVTRQAGDDEIRDAYFTLAKRTHPDRFSHSSDAVRRVAEEVFGLVSRAFEQVGTREARVEYLRAERKADENRAAREEGERAVRAELAFQKGKALLARKAHAEAVARFREAVEGFAEEGEYHAYLGWAMYLENPKSPAHTREARKVIVRGGKLAPDSEKPYLFLGRIYRAEGSMDRAERMFQKVISLDPDCVDAIRELRLIDMRRQKSRGLVRRILRR